MTVSKIIFVALLIGAGLCIVLLFTGKGSSNGLIVGLAVSIVGITVRILSRKNCLNNYFRT